MFGHTRRAVCCLLGLIGVMAFAQSARADTVNIAPDLECGIQSRLGYADVPCLPPRSGRLVHREHAPVRRLLQFDVAGSLPNGAEVLSATLHMNRDEDPFGPTSGAPLSVFPMLQAWTDQGTWESLGGVEEEGYDNPGASDVAEDSVAIEDGPNAWDVTRLVRAWATASEPNNGLGGGRRRGFPSGERSAFHSSSATNPALRALSRGRVLLPVPVGSVRGGAVVSGRARCMRGATTLLAAFRQGGPPTSLSRAAAMMNVGIYDAFNSVFFAKLEDVSTGDPEANETCGWKKFEVLAETPASTDANLAARFAARDILTALFPGYSTQIASAFTTRYGSPPYQAAGKALGEFVADEVLAARASDGSGASMSYTPASSTPGAWRPSPTSSTEAPCTAAVPPGWGNVTPFTLTSGSQFRQAFPGAFTTYPSLLASSLYTPQFNDVKSYGKSVGSARTTDQTKAAWFWANDLDGTYKPPGQLIEHTKLVAQTQPAAQTSGDPEDFFWVWSQQGIRVAQLFAEVSLALADAAIAAWDQKYLTAIDLWRPIDAIRQATPTATTTRPRTRRGSRSRATPTRSSSRRASRHGCRGTRRSGATWSRVMENEFRVRGLRLIRSR